MPFYTYLKPTFEVQAVLQARTEGKMIRFLKEEDRNECIKLMEEFYETDAVSHKIPKEYIENTVDFALSDSPFNKIIICKSEESYAGFCHLSFTYSCEVGGLVLMIEEIYIKDEFKGKGFGTALFVFMRNEYDATVKRYRLEVVESNKPAIKLYERLGFGNLAYKQMILDI